MTSEPLRILVVDDHPMFRFGLTAMLDAEPGFTVVGEAADGHEAVQAAEALHPDVVVMDVHLPGISGVEATRRIVTALPDVGVLMLTMSDESESVFATLRVGAHGYLLKNAQPEEIVRAIEAVGRGEAIFGPDVATRVLSLCGSGPSTVRPPFPELTTRELEVLDLLSRGDDNSSIARTLCLSPKTVRNHISNVFSKLQVTNRAQAIVRARDAGLGLRPLAPR
jgi:DNA-binding NarL/FixJ family response regulator